MDCSTPGFPVHQLLELAQTHMSLSEWCHPSISSSVIPFSCLQSFPASGSFPMSQFFASGDQSFGVSASGSVLPMNIQDWFSLGRTGWISLQSKGLSRIFFSITVQKCQFFSAQCSAFFIIHLSHPYIATGKTIALTSWTFVDSIMSLLFNMLSRLVIAFLPRNNYLVYFFFQKTKDILWANAIDWALCTFWRMAPVFLFFFLFKKILIGG